MTRTDPYPNPIGWRTSGTIHGGLAHYFYGHITTTWTTGKFAHTICSAATFHETGLLFPERMARRRCKTCDRSATKRGMR